MRGEQFKTAALSGSPLGSPPLARGTVCMVSCCVGDGGITPACAGNRLKLPPPLCDKNYHPRLRGEQTFRLRPSARPWGSPPLARGTASFFLYPKPLAGITPACAANSPACHSRGCTNRDHPRLRGEQPVRADEITWRGGSPPLARGTGCMRCVCLQ